MKMIFTVSILSIFLNTAFAAKDAKDPIVAEVNGTKIKKSTLFRYHNKNLHFVKSDKKATLKNSLNDLIDRIVGIEKAKKANLHKKPSVIKKMNDILYHAQISKDLDPQLKKIKVTDKEVKSYYSKNPEYRTAQILYRLRVAPSKEDVKKATEQSYGIYEVVTKKPESFLVMAAKYSQTSNAPIGGDLGYQPRAKLTPEFFAAIKNKEVGFITKPFRTQYGFHVVKVLGVKEYKQINIKMYKKIIYDQKRDKILAGYFAKSRKQSKIKLYKQHMK